MSSENDELIKQVRDWCKWFWDPRDKTCRCGYWVAGKAIAKSGMTCPVLDAAVNDDDNQPVFVPEPVRGNPIGKDIIFLGVNPGGGVTKDKENCPWVDGQIPEQWRGELEDSDAFADFNLGATTSQRDGTTPRGFESDNVARAATSLLWSRDNNWMLPSEPLPKHTDSVFTTYLSKVAVVNQAHCKCRSYTKSVWSNPERYRNQHAIWETCGRRTAELLKMCRPRLVVAMGWPTVGWLDNQLSNDRTLHADTDVAAFLKDGFPNGRNVRITHEQDAGLVLEILFSYHPSSKEFKRGWPVVIGKARQILQ